CRSTTPPRSVGQPPAPAPSAAVLPAAGVEEESEGATGEDLPRVVTLPRPRLLWRKAGDQAEGSMPRARAVAGFSWAAERNSVGVRRTGTEVPLWSEGAAGRENHAFAAPVITADRAYILKPNEVVARELASGRVLRRWPLPAYLNGYVRGVDAMLVADGPRVA